MLSDMYTTCFEDACTRYSFTMRYLGFRICTPLVYERFTPDSLARRISAARHIYHMFLRSVYEIFSGEYLGFRTSTPLVFKMCLPDPIATCILAGQHLYNMF